MNQQQIATLFVFPSGSSPTRQYQTLQYIDGSLSCDCKGWIFRRGPVRTCKHVRFVEAGLGNIHAVRVVEYSTPAPIQARTPQRAMNQPVLPERKPGRVFDLEEA